jgi:hypothetical protein
MKKGYIFTCFTIWVLNTEAQKGPGEVMLGSDYLHYQHSLAQSFNATSRFGWQHIATFIDRYKTNNEKGGFPDELMNQAYVTFRLSKIFSIKGGLFYTNKTGFKPSAGAQLFITKKNWTFLLSPRVDVVKKGSYELFSLLEFSPSLSGELNLYLRLQAMSNAAKKHNRSYQLLRIGLQHKRLQYGVALNFDEYGQDGTVYVNSGVFIRRIL